MRAHTRKVSAPEFLLTRLAGASLSFGCRDFMGAGAPEIDRWILWDSSSSWQETLVLIFMLFLLEHWFYGIEICALRKKRAKNRWDQNAPSKKTEDEIGNSIPHVVSKWSHPFSWSFFQNQTAETPSFPGSPFSVRLDYDKQTFRPASRRVHHATPNRRETSTKTSSPWRCSDATHIGLWR